MTVVAESATDSRFKASCVRILQAHLDDSEFEVTDFCAEIGMSRTQLHRKMKAMFGCSTTEYIRNYRLKKAVQLLRNSDNNISEVAYLTGFNSRNYFSRSFRQVFGMSPRKYLDELINQSLTQLPISYNQ